jgi:hypothetical protein
VKRVRSASESLLSIALGLEAVLVFFVMLTAFGLKALPPGAAFGGGIGLILLLVLAARFVRYEWGVWFGWLLQVALVATGILLPVMYFIGLGFAAIWVFCFVKGRQLDRAKARFDSQYPNTLEETP